MKRAKIAYPCEWEYRVVGADEASLKNAVSAALGDREYRLAPSHVSAKGNYIALKLVAVVEDETVRDRIFTSLSGDPRVKMVL